MSESKKAENRREDSKAFKKFLVIIIVAFIGGGAVGFFGGMARKQGISILVWLEGAMAEIAPYAAILITTITLIISEILIVLSRKHYGNWNGEEEEVIERIERKLSWALLASNANTVLAYFFFGLGFSGMQTLTREDLYNVRVIIRFATLLAGIVYAMVVMLILQRQVINLEKEINPEKRGSVYDPSFQKRWLESCDEGELLQIYKAGFKAYQITMNACLVLWVITTLGIVIFDFGIGPMTCVVLIWLVLMLSYSIESIKVSKNRNV